MSDDTQLTTPEPEEMQPEPVAEPLPELDIKQAKPVETTWGHQPEKTPPKDASKGERTRKTPAREVVSWRDPTPGPEDAQPAVKLPQDEVVPQAAESPRRVVEEAGEEKGPVRAESAEPEVASARRASVQSAEEHRQAVRDLHQLMVDISQENLGLHRRSLEAIRDLTADMTKLKRRLARLATAKG